LTLARPKAPQIRGASPQSAGGWPIPPANAHSNAYNAAEVQPIFEGHKSVLLQKLAHEVQCRPLVPLTLDQNIKDFALGVDGAPQIGHAAIDLEIDLVEMPGRVRLGATSAQVRCYHWPEMVHPPAHSFISNRDAAFCQQIFDIAKAHGKSQIEPDRLLDDLGREPVPFVPNFLHSLGYRTASKAASPIRRDSAISDPGSLRRDARL
jgi:hypothetical protein